jgi:outer membrane protein
LVLANNNEKVLQEQLRASQERLNVGDATNTDVAQSQARLANATSSRVIAEGDFVKAKADFVKVFGVEAEENIPMPDRLPDIPATLDQSIKIGLNNNPQILQLGYLVKSRDNDIGVQSSALLPQVDMTGAISDVESPTNFGLVTTESNSLGVNVTVPLY